jgi:hypothetical protein
VSGQSAAHLSNLQIIGCLVFDICSGKFHRVNETAAYVIGELKRQTPVSGIVAAYAQRYAVSPAVAERDVELFMNSIAVRG